MGVSRYKEILMKRFIILIKKYYYLLTALLMFLSFPSHDLWLFKGFTFFAWISLIPLFLYIRDKGYKEIVISTFVAGLIGNFLSYNWIGYFGARVEGGYVVVLLFLIPSLTGFFLTKMLIAEYLSRNCEVLRFIIYPSVWISIDWIQSIGFLAFPWVYWGYSQYQFSSFIQIASFTGVMGITFIVVLINYVISDFIFIKISEEISLRESIRTPHFKRLIAILLIVFALV